MKKVLLTLLVSIAFTAFSFAQTDVTLNINHKLGASDFAMNMASENNMNNKFNVQRLQYYISEIIIVHDGGTETPIIDLYILADAENVLSQNLGNYNITNIEGIKFSIGVDEANNHLDPARFRTSEPLGPKSPSMHWGWAAGYRFLAIEGKAGNGLNRQYEIHALGDSNYHQTSIDFTATSENNAVTIELDADYTRILDDISLSNGVIDHSEVGDDAKKSLLNFRDFVFTPAGVSSAKDLAQITAFDVYPNPTTTGQITVNFSSLENANYQVQVINILGQALHTENITNGESDIQLNDVNKGVYLITLIKEGELLTSKKLVVE